MITRGGSAAYLRQPTNLHFSANWKQSRFSGISEVKVLLEIADNASWWPSILRNTPAAEPEQATIWRAIKIGGDPWVKNLREATEAVVDRIAWMAVRDLHPRIETALAAQARSEAVAETALAAQARSEAVAETLRAEVEALRASPSWRITAPLRNIARLLRSQRHVTW
jgi:hypothetical protein